MWCLTAGCSVDITDPSATGLTYLHGDRLGSMVEMSDAAGQLIDNAARGFDPFGKPREGDWSNSNHNDAAGGSVLLPNDLNRPDLTTRGFTGHEQLNNVALTHMNGRAYDYNLGRFLSVDPVIQFPANSQSLNPYSYVLNNPLAGTDPTGYLVCFTEPGEECPSTNSGAGTTSAKCDSGANCSVIHPNGIPHENGKTDSSSTTDSGSEVSEIGFHAKGSGDVTQNENGLTVCGSSNMCNEFLDASHSKAGTVNKKGFDTQTDANLAAAREYGPASKETNREVKWITFKYNDENGDLKWGYTFAAVGKASDKTPKNVGPPLQRALRKLRKEGYTPASQGHSHFDNNLNFSGADLLAVIGEEDGQANNVQVLVDVNGEVSWIDRSVLNEQEELRSSGEIMQRAKLDDTGINGKVLGNIYDEN